MEELWLIRQKDPRNREAAMTMSAGRSPNYPPPPEKEWFQYGSEADITKCAEIFLRNGNEVEILHIANGKVQQLTARQISVVLEEVSPM